MRSWSKWVIFSPQVVVLQQVRARSPALREWSVSRSRVPVGSSASGLLARARGSAPVSVAVAVRVAGASWSGFGGAARPAPSARRARRLRPRRAGIRVRRPPPPSRRPSRRRRPPSRSRPCCLLPGPVRGLLEGGGHRVVVPILTGPGPVRVISSHDAGPASPSGRSWRSDQPDPPRCGGVTRPAPFTHEPAGEVMTNQRITVPQQSPAGCRSTTTPPSGPSPSRTAPGPTRSHHPGPGGSPPTCATATRRSSTR